MSELTGAALTLFIVMDPLGNVPLFGGLLRRVPEARQRRIILREHLIALAVLSLALYLGPGLMLLLGIESHALQIGGGVVMFVIALRMIFPGQSGVFGDEVTAGEPLVVPLAVPLIAGPSSLAVVMLLATSDPLRLGRWLLALVTAWLASLAVLSLAPLLRRLLGERGLAAGERLMGLVLCLVAAQMLTSGVAEFVRCLGERR